MSNFNLKFILSLYSRELGDMSSGGSKGGGALPPLKKKFPPFSYHLSLQLIQYHLHFCPLRKRLLKICKMTR